MAAELTEADHYSVGGSAAHWGAACSADRSQTAYLTDQRSAGDSVGSAAHYWVDLRSRAAYLTDQRSAGGSAGSAAHYSIDLRSRAAWTGGYFAERCSAADCLAAAPVDSRSEADQAGWPRFAAEE
jgi:hypothetical protein